MPEIRCSPERVNFAGNERLGCLFDLSKHVSMHMNDELGKEIGRLVDIFDDYEYCSE